MNALTSPHVFADLLIQQKQVEHRQEKDISFYKEQDHLESSKNKSGLIGLKEPRRTFNILADIEIPKIVDQNFNIAMEFLNEDFVRISEQLDSGESPVNEQLCLKEEREEIAKKKLLLQNKLDEFKEIELNLVKSRTFLTLSLYSYEQYKKYIEVAEDGLFFLNNNNNLQEHYFYKELLTQEQYLKFEQLYLSAKTPADLRVLFLSLINNPIGNEKLAISYHEHAISGFYLHVSEGSASESLSDLAKEKPNYLEYDSYLGCWILKTDSLSDVFPKILEMFDIWLDVGQVAIYRKESVPLSFNLDTQPLTTQDTSYTYGILFDYISPPPHVVEKDVLDQINDLKLDGEIKNIEFLQNEQFQKANSGVLWSYAELLLIKFNLEKDLDELTFEDQSIEYLAIYSTKNHKIIFYTQNIGFIADNCLILFKNTINLLNINSFEQVNPYILLNS